MHDVDRSNVERYDQREVERVDHGSIALMLATALYASASREQRSKIKDATKCWAYGRSAKNRADAAALLNLIDH
jgi:hypothetical protein